MDSAGNIRILISANEPFGSEAGDAYQVVHLAQPLLDRLHHRTGRIAAREPGQGGR